ncbi:hypothetical protein, partial [Aestuariispira insulae]|uniref:hypothetical protein n=1 Tax=Aestuariispira insulae TaxID=1461337 RepID=UPI001C3FEA43
RALWRSWISVSSSFPYGLYDEPEILRYAISLICPKDADGEHGLKAAAFLAGGNAEADLGGDRAFLQRGHGGGGLQHRRGRGHALRGGPAFALGQGLGQVGDNEIPGTPYLT